MKRLAAALACLATLAQTPASAPGGFTIAQPGYAFAFPKDHGAHPDYRTEWWYVTGHLWDAKGKRVGFQLTFFREATPKAAWTGNAAWRSDQLILAHATLSDEAAGRFTFDERFNREGLAAGAAEDHLGVFNESWRLDTTATGFSLAMQVKGAALDLRLEPQTPPVIFGEHGVSRKGADPTATSHYVTFPRLAAQGALTAPGAAPRQLSGEAWMDHEWSSNYLSSDQVGWDWAGLQLKDGRSLMAFRLRHPDGSQDPWSVAQEVGVDGRITRSTHDFTMTPEGAWTSPASGARYPIPLRLDAFGESFHLMPTLKDQELRTARSTGITYWEGDCRVLDSNGRAIGEAYLELTGYAHGMKGRF
ncbi:MAG TPA: lipocalin-like domain-containing protein [Holophagaceae bacterium]|nr:lipocalin-like domain-containing protein [Holophagaceae bacterium]